MRKFYFFISEPRSKYSFDISGLALKNLYLANIYSMKPLKRNDNIAVGVSLIVILFFLFIVVDVFNFFEGGARLSDLTQFSDTALVNVTTEEGLVISDSVAGEGFAAEAGMLVTAHYRGTFQDGTVFDSSYERGAPIQFILGAGQVIPGWEQGIFGMKVGGSRSLVIPPNLAYGEAGVVAPDGTILIPSNASLFFDIELISVEMVPAPE